MEQGRSTSLRFSSKSNKLIPRDISESLGKLPPQARDLEEAVLGALMLEKNALNAVVEFLKAEHFYVDAHKEIYQAIIDLFKASELHTVVVVRVSILRNKRTRNDYSLFHNRRC